MSRAPLMRKVRPREVKWLAQGHTVMARLWPQTGCLQGLWALHCHASFSVGVICLMLASLFLCWSTFNLRQLVHRFWYCDQEKFAEPHAGWISATVCLILCSFMDCNAPGFCPWDSPSKNTGVGCHALLQGIFRSQGSNLRPYVWVFFTSSTTWKALQQQTSSWF